MNNDKDCRVGQKNRSKCKGFQEIVWNIVSDNIGPIANDAFKQKDGI